MRNPSSLKTEKQKYKTERFTLHQEKPGRWKVSGRDSEGNYRRIRFDAKDLNEAINKANVVLEEKTKSEMAIQPPNVFEPIHISDALLRASESRNWTEYTREKDVKFCEYFLEWVDKEGLTYWQELRYEHVLKYRSYLESKNFAFNTIRLYLLPVRRSASWATSNWPKQYVNICQGLRLSRKDLNASTYQEDRGNPYLPIHQVLDFLDYLSRGPQRQKLLLGVALQGLMGLQLQEALRLTWGKIDFTEETITIDGVVKNSYRVRKIPAVNVVIWVLRCCYCNQSPSELLVPDYVAYDNYSRAFKREMNRWNPEIFLKPKDLRNTIQTAAIDGDWYGYYVQRYVGHAPTTIGERYYHGDQGKRILPLFREKVVARIEEEIRQWNTPSDSWIIPSPRLVVNQ